MRAPAHRLWARLRRCDLKRRRRLGIDPQASAAHSWHFPGQKLRLGGDALGADPTYLLYLPSRSRGELRRIDFAAWPRTATFRLKFSPEPTRKPLLHTRGISRARSFDLEVTPWALTRVTSCISHTGPEESYGASTLPPGPHTRRRCLKPSRSFPHEAEAIWRSRGAADLEQSDAFTCPWRALASRRTCSCPGPRTARAASRTSRSGC